MKIEIILRHLRRVMRVCTKRRENMKREKNYKIQRKKEIGTRSKASTILTTTTTTVGWFKIILFPLMKSLGISYQNQNIHSDIFWIFLKSPSLPTRPFIVKKRASSFCKFQFTEIMVHLVYVTPLFLCISIRGGYFWAYF